MMRLTEPRLVCIFAEYIRNEVSGQSTIIGTYFGNAIHHPNTGTLKLTSFAVQCLLEVPLELDLKPISFELMLDGTVLQTINMPAEASEAFVRDRAAQIKRDPQLRAFMIAVALQLGNFAVPKPGFFRVRAQVSQQEVWSNALEFAAPATAV